MNNGFMSVIDFPTVIPAPSPSHLAVLDDLRGWLAEGIKRLHSAYGPGLITLVLYPRTDDWRLGFTPRHLADALPVTAMGVPPKAATSILHRLSSYDPDHTAALLVVEEGYRENAPFSFIEMDLV
jgi:hypothetical protein